MQPHFALVQAQFRSLGSKDLLHPLLTTFGDLPFSGSLPELSDCNPNPHQAYVAHFFWRHTNFVSGGPNKGG